MRLMSHSRRDPNDNPKIRDLIGYLNALARAAADDTVGNPVLRNGLSDLVAVLKPLSKLPLDQLGSSLTAARKERSLSILSRPKLGQIELVRFDRMTSTEIKRAIQDPSLRKADLAEIAFERFGISRAKTMRLRKHEVLADINAAASNEDALNVISEQARRSGMARTS